MSNLPSSDTVAGAAQRPLVPRPLWHHRTALVCIDHGPSQRDAGDWEIHQSPAARTTNYPVAGSPRSGPWLASRGERGTAYHLAVHETGAQTVIHEESPEKIMAAQWQLAGMKAAVDTSEVASKAAKHHRSTSLRLAAAKTWQIAGRRLQGRQALAKIPRVMLSPRHKPTSRYAGQQLKSLSPIASMQPNEVEPLCCTAGKTVLPDVRQLDGKELQGASQTQCEQLEPWQSLEEQMRPLHNHAGSVTYESVHNIGEVVFVPDQPTRQENVLQMSITGGSQMRVLTPNSLSLASTQDDESRNCSLHSGSEDVADFSIGQKVSTLLPEQDDVLQRELFSPCDMDLNEKDKKRVQDQKDVLAKESSRNIAEEHLVITSERAAGCQLEQVTTGVSIACLRQDIVDLTSQIVKRLAFESWNRQCTNRQRRNVAVEYAGYKFYARRMIKYSILHLWTSYMSERHVQSKTFRRAINLRESTARRMLKQLTFEVWNRQTSVLIWTHGRLRLAAHRSRRVSLQTTWARLRQHASQRQMKRAVKRQVARRAERNLLRRIWSGLVVHIIHIQLNEIHHEITSGYPFSAATPANGNCGAQHSEKVCMHPHVCTSNKTEEVESCKRALFPNTETPMKAIDAKDLAQPQEGATDYTKTHELRRQILMLSQMQATLVSQLCEKLGRRRDVAAQQVKVVVMAEGEKSLQKNMLQGSLALCSHDPCKHEPRDEMPQYKKNLEAGRTTLVEF